MREEALYFSHTAALCALFVLGDTVMTAPYKNSNEFTFTALILVCILGVFSSLLFLPFLRKILNLKVGKSKLLSNATVGLFCGALAVLSLFCAADTFENLFIFATEVILPETAVALIAAVLFLSALFFTLQKKSALLKFSLIAAVFAIIVIGIFFIGLSSEYNFRNIFIFRFPPVKTLINQGQPYLKNCVLHLLPLCAFVGFKYKKSHSKAAFLGIGIGFILLLLCVVGSILLFGPSLAGDLDFAFSQFISTFSVGRLYTRLDILSYFLFFITSIIKIAVLGSVVKECLLKTEDLFLLFNRG